VIAQFAAAIAFLTRLPVGRGLAFDAKDVGRAARWFPLVGALLGAVYVAALWLLGPIFPPLVVAVIIVAIEAIITGGLHFDGVADTADGFGGGRTAEDVLRIMKDHAIGAYGAIALILVIVLKIATIAALIDARRAGYALLLAPILARWSAVLLSATEKYARSDGSPTSFVGRTELIVATVIAISAAVTLDPWRGIAGFALVAAGSAWWGRRCRRRIGGVTGDALGAAIEVAECIVLLTYAARHG
jgi:cobalamin 5'-phosphate synthase/cobalamin synthase